MPSAGKDDPRTAGSNHSTSRDDDTQLLILQEVKKANSCLNVFSDRLEALETRLAAVESNQLTSTSTSVDSSVDSRRKRKVPAKVRVSLVLLPVQISV